MPAPEEHSKVLGSALIGTGQHCASQHLSLLRISNPIPLPGPRLTYYHKCCPNPPSGEYPNTLDKPKRQDAIQRNPLTLPWWFHLKHCVQLWNPAPSLEHKKDTDLSQQLQRRATGMMTGLKNLSFEDRLREWAFLSLQKAPGSLIAAF